VPGTTGVKRRWCLFFQGTQGGEGDAEPCRMQGGRMAELKTEVTLGMVFGCFRGS
jgi:hypothetical protein